MANPSVMIVGGGLAGLAAAMKLAELGIQVDLMSLTPGQTLAQRVCPGRHQQRQRRHPAAGRQRMAAPRRHRLRRRLPAASAAGQGNVPVGPQDHRPDGSAGRAVQSHAGGLSRSAPFWRHAVQADRLCRRHHGPAIALCPGRSGPPLERGRQGQDLRSLGLPGPRARCQRHLPRALSARTWSRWRSAPSRPTR